MMKSMQSIISKACTKCNDKKQRDSFYNIDNICEECEAIAAIRHIYRYARVDAAIDRLGAARARIRKYYGSELYKYISCIAHLFFSGAVVGFCDKKKIYLLGAVFIFYCMMAMWAMLENLVIIL